jgi:hypothetical protein
MQPKEIVEKEIRKRLLSLLPSPLKLGKGYFFWDKELQMTDENIDGWNACLRALRKRIKEVKDA